ncbi:hypothetical protein [Streptomyces sp. MZ04]|uniref:hypothetical protein n=1 Tax=Streptomyces sp. MZ04 TaxID=2559236 RepID=UPI00107EAE54|nr:hypothetical protein [Streptomyces sp. MZ04]TGB13296.1 hypothetical protein E2651_09795 [Streptomyces sp. MZ04]
MDEINPLIRDAVERITIGMAEAFDIIWSRPDAAQIIENFLDGSGAFLVERDGITVMSTDESE